MSSDIHLRPALARVQEAPRPSFQHTSFEGACKRVLDVNIAALMLFLLLPLMVCIYGLIRFDSGRPILFRQQRVGLGGRSFACLKFRTMTPNADKVLQELLERSPEARREWEQSFKLRNDPRVTPLGKFLRRSSLDELPQLFNVLAGDMSLVGPRPIVAAEMSRYGEALPLYLSVRPGLTGLWQVSGRSDCSYPERVALDEHYVQTWSLWNDAKIALRTINAVLSRRGSF
ncbi:sugar transferase [Microvirga terricola]|uniref:Sugar transferase n=1 Tax=Microvirga terricola TaxID=2719797 RepID=A0ABX0VE22_9HYPH|nr:sugar transferase [Microvirga terricola]NIX78084.1 sugar transferase [Microvirga terricola]